MSTRTLSCCMVLLLCAAVLFASDITVDIEGFRNDKGQCLVSLFSQGKGFPGEHNDAMQMRIVEVSAGIAKVVFTDLPPGTYAVSVCHDENKDGKMNSGLLGRPKEGYAIYKPQEAKLGPPSFAKSAFDLGTNSMKIAVEVVYP